MAKRDVREYCYALLQQYLEMKDDLADFNQAFQDGYITEDKLTEVQDDVARLKENYDRVLYIVYLLDLPNNSKKKAKARKANSDIESYMTNIDASSTAIIDENKTILTRIRAELKALTK